MSEKTLATRRRFSYSLRSLVALITLLAMILGWTAYERRQSQREVQIAKLLEAGGARAPCCGLFAPARYADQPSWWHQALSSFYGPRLLTVDLRDCPSFVDLSPLAGLTCLEGVAAEGTQVADLAPLAGCTSLQFLHFGETPAGDLAPLRGLKNLRQLFLNDTRVADLSPLAGLTDLQILDLNATRVADLSPLAKLTRLQALGLRGTQVNDLSALAGLKSLQSLDLDGTDVSDVTPLAGLVSLEGLWLRRTQVSDAQVAELQRALPNCLIVGRDAD